MKKIFGIVCFILCMVLFTGCSCSVDDNKPDEAVETFFEKYRSKDDNIITQLKETIENEELTDDEQSRYQELMEKQYDQFAYVIKDTKEDENTAVVTVELTVLDYKSAITKAEEELRSDPDKFKDDKGNHSDEKYMDYKIEEMDKVTDTITETIDLNLTKENGMWKVDDLSNEDIQKLHGLY